MRDCAAARWSPATSPVFGEVTGSPPLLQVARGVEEELVPVEGEACGQRCLHQAGREAFEEASDPLLSGDLNHAVHQAPVAPHLRTRGNVSSSFVLFFKSHDTLQTGFRSRLGMGGGRLLDTDTEAEKLTCPK